MLIVRQLPGCCEAGLGSSQGRFKVLLVAFELRVSGPGRSFCGISLRPAFGFAVYLDVPPCRVSQCFCEYIGHLEVRVF